MVSKFAVVGCLITFSFGADAAIIDLEITNDGTNILTVTGELVDGDSRKFNDLAVRLDTAVVLFDSPGGLLVEGLAIGRTISIKGFNTAVGEQSMCASACGLAWLAGQQKLLFSSSKVGFHAVYDLDTTKTVSSAGNALVGAYLQRLGFNNELIVYATETNPSLMRWLNQSDAKQMHLDVTLLDELQSEATAPSLANNQPMMKEPNEPPKLRKLSDELDPSLSDIAGNPTGTLYEVK